MAKFHRNYSGRGIVADFRRLLTTGDVAKLTPRLYDLLVQSGGFIAHFDINGFRATYDGKLGELLAGEFYRLDDPEVWMRDFNVHLEDIDYRDGMTAGDVMREVAKIGAELAPQVRETERFRRRSAEIGHLCQRYGIDNVTAAAMVDGKRAEV